MNSLDKTHRFLFDNTDVRGEIVTLDKSFKGAVQSQALSPGLKCLLGDFIAAVALLSESMKFEGVLTLQARGDGSVPLVMAEATHKGEVRGIVRQATDDIYQEKPALNQALGKGIVTLTIDPTKGERYQGIVPLDGEQLADCLTHYFKLSEQLPSRLWLFSNTEKCAGLMLQNLPAQQVTDESERLNTWETLESLANTATAEELFTVDHETLLYRLFHEMECRLFPAREIKYQCSCTRERSANAIVSLGKSEAMSFVKEKTVIEMDCQFCGKRYEFSEPDVEKLFDGSGKNLH